MYRGKKERCRLVRWQTKLAENSVTTWRCVLTGRTGDVALGINLSLSLSSVHTFNCTVLYYPRFEQQHRSLERIMVKCVISPSALAVSLKAQKIVRQKLSSSLICQTSSPNVAG